MLYGTDPSYDSLRTFGCLSYAHDKDKFGHRSRRCLFVGYPYGKKAWNLYDRDTNEFFSSCDIVFIEDQFPGIKDKNYVTPPLFSPDIAIDDWLLPFSPTSTISPVVPDSAPVTVSTPTTITTTPSPITETTSATKAAITSQTQDT